MSARRCDMFCMECGSVSMRGAPCIELSTSPAIRRADHSLNTSPAALFKAVSLSRYHFSIFQLYFSYYTSWHGRLGYQNYQEFHGEKQLLKHERCSMFSLTPIMPNVLPIQHILMVPECPFVTFDHQYIICK